jgi:hypothetical protein
VGEACWCWSWIKGVRGLCRVVPSGLAHTRASVVLAKFAVREVSSLLCSTATHAELRTVFHSASRYVDVAMSACPGIHAYIMAYDFARMLFPKFETILQDVRATTSLVLVRTSPFPSFVESGTNLSRLFEQLQLRYKPSKNVPRTTRERLIDLAALFCGYSGLIAFVHIMFNLVAWYCLFTM